MAVDRNHRPAAKHPDGARLAGKDTASLLRLNSNSTIALPHSAVPVSVVGTFAALYLFGFSINTLTLFGLVLAIGIVVDDAIVVVENVERNIEEGRTPLQAAHQAMPRRRKSPPSAVKASVLAPNSVLPFSAT